MARTLRMLLLGGCVMLGGCATMANRGKVRTAPDPTSGRSVRVARVELKNVGSGNEGLLHFLLPGELTVYEGSTQLPIFSEDSANNDNRWRARCRLGASDQATRGACDRAIFYPYLELDKRVPHTLRLVRSNGSEATVTVRAGTRILWFWANGIWGPAAPLGWVVDAMSGKWTYFGSLDVDRAFRQASTVAVGAGRR